MKAILTLFTSLALCLGAQAADKKNAVPSAKLSDFAVGELVSGPAVDLANTGGKAVVIEEWGVNCGPCLAFMPEMEKLAKRNKKDTIFIGAESQGSADTAIKDIIKKNKLSYSITKGGLTKNPLGSKGLPHVMVFDTTGTLIYAGRPEEDDFKKAVAKAGRPAAGASSSSLLKK